MHLKRTPTPKSFRVAYNQKCNPRGFFIYKLLLSILFLGANLTFYAIIHALTDTPMDFMMPYAEF